MNEEQAAASEPGREGAGPARFSHGRAAVAVAGGRRRRQTGRRDPTTLRISKGHHGHDTLTYSKKPAIGKWRMPF
jgi:hypothetical protein